MNPKYYVTPEEAEKVRAFLNKYSIGGGVEKASELIYFGPVAVPQREGKSLLHLRLANGCDMNAGIVLAMMTNGQSEARAAEVLQYIARPEPRHEDD